MTLGHPLVDAALDDLRLSRVELNVFRFLWGRLDFEHWRRMKADVVAIEVGTERSYAGAAIRKLVELGYIAAGDRDEKGVVSYRLPRTVPTLGASSPTSDSPTRIRRQVRSAL